MTFFQAIILGLVQGFTEFLPISSSGHLVIAEKLLGVPATTSLSFEIIVHLATLMAVIFFFWKDIIALKFNDYKLLAIGTIPAVFFGVIFKDFITHAFSSTLNVSIELFITALILFAAQYKLTHPTESDKKAITPWRAFIIGIWQAVSILPGISRSGSTVAGALFMNIEREKAFRFSFLLSIPAILGAAVFSLLDIWQGGQFFSTQEVPTMVVGAFFSFIAGMISLQWFRAVIKKAQLHYFAIYCVVISTLLFAYSIQAM